jgi:hypothetical protein
MTLVVSLSTSCPVAVTHGRSPVSMVGEEVDVKKPWSLSQCISRLLASCSCMGMDDPEEGALEVELSLR